MQKIKDIFKRDEMIIVYIMLIICTIGFTYAHFRSEPKTLSRTYMIHYQNGTTEKFTYKYHDNVLDQYTKVYLINGCVKNYHESTTFRCGVKKIRQIK